MNQENIRSSIAMNRLKKKAVVAGRNDEAIYYANDPHDKDCFPDVGQAVG